MDHNDSVHILNEPTGYTCKIGYGKHHWVADEPVDVGGADEGPDPYGLLLSSLGACTAITVRMYAKRKEWPLTNIGVELYQDHNYYDDCVNCEDDDAKLSVIKKVLTLEGDLSEDQIKRLKIIASKCPVHKSLQASFNIVTV